MYKIDLANNQLMPLNPQSFSGLHLRERDHLQEWIAKHPAVLGEELLIIQKEYAGFDETNERLDLLALDKQGRLVIIENKLDDSGRDVVWQAQKYAAYCSTLSKSDILEIYQAYLQRYAPDENAAEAIQAFLGRESLDEIDLNPAHHQRLIYVAANFRKEVTSTVLWLMEYGLQIQCFKVTPYQYGEDVFLSVEQTLPAPDTEDLMIKRAAKEADSERSRRTQHNNSQRYQLFWSQMLDALNSLALPYTFNPDQKLEFHWIGAKTGSAKLSFELILRKKDLRMEIKMPHSYEPVLRSHQAKIEQQLQCPIEWDTSGSKLRIFAYQAFETSDSNQWPEMIQWTQQKLPVFQCLLAEAIREAEGIQT